MVCTRVDGIKRVCGTSWNITHNPSIQVTQLWTHIDTNTTEIDTGLTSHQTFATIVYKRTCFMSHDVTQCARCALATMFVFCPPFSRAFRRQQQFNPQKEMHLAVCPIPKSPRPNLLTTPTSRQWAVRCVRAPAANCSLIVARLKISCA